MILVKRGTVPPLHWKKEKGIETSGCKKLRNMLE